jgi:hypothetical protein
MAHQRLLATTAAIFPEGKRQGKTDFPGRKGDHRHVREKEHAYRFKSVEQLLAFVLSMIASTAPALDGRSVSPKK